MTRRARSGSRRHPLRTAVAAAAGGALVGLGACGGDAAPDLSGSPTPQASEDASEAPTSTATTIVELQLHAEPAESAAYEAVVEAFELARPDVDVQMVVLAGDEHLTRLTTAFDSGEPPDVFLIDYREYAPFVQRGAVDPIGPLLDLDPASYYQEPIEAFTIGGTLQCMPESASSLVVYYNRELFEAAGLAIPIQAWSWGSFAQAARTLTTAGVHGVGLDPRLRALAPFIWGNGGDIVDDLDDPTTMTLDEPAARDALEQIVELQREGVSPTRDDVAAAGLAEQFVNGTLAMYLGSRADTAGFREQGVEFDVAPLPVFGEPASILQSDAYCIAAGTDELDAAVDFVTFATGEQGQTLSSLGGGTVPSLVNVATSAAFLDPASAPASSHVFLDAIPLLRRTPVLTTWSEVETVVDELLGQAFYDDRPLDDVLVEIRDTASPLLQAGALP